MLGAINGHHVNRFAVNANLVYGLSFGDLDVTQADATVAAGATAANGAASAYGQAPNTLSATAASTLGAMAALLADDQMFVGDASAAVASMAESTKDNDALVFVGRSMARHPCNAARLDRHGQSAQLTPRDCGARLTAHENSAQLTPHDHGSTLTAH